MKFYISGAFSIAINRQSHASHTHVSRTNHELKSVNETCAVDTKWPMFHRIIATKYKSREKKEQTDDKFECNSVFNDHRFIFVKSRSLMFAA